MWLNYTLFPLTSANICSSNKGKTHNSIVSLWIQNIFLLPQYHSNEHFHTNVFRASITFIVYGANINKCKIPQKELCSLGSITLQLQSVHRTSCQNEDKGQSLIWYITNTVCYSLAKWASPLDVYRHSVINAIMLQNRSKIAEHLVPVSLHWFEIINSCVIIGRKRYHFRGIHMAEDLH